MNAITEKLSPNAVGMIRADHTRLLSIFHQFDVDTRASLKQGIVDSACLALDVHAQLEEEIFYPALREVAASDPVLARSVPEHGEMRRLMARLRGMSPNDIDYDRTFMELMRDVMHHAADEETTLLPLAEQLLGDRLTALGAQMANRRMQLMAPHAGEFVVNTWRRMPAGPMLVALGAVVAGSLLAKRSMGRQPRRY